MRRAFSPTVFGVALVGLAAPSFATIFSYTATLDGPSESPPNASPGTGTAQADYDDVAHTLHLQISFTGLIGTTSGAHIHSPTSVPLTGVAGVATAVPAFAGFPLGVTSGNYNQILDLTNAANWNPAFIAANGATPAGAEAALASHLAEGRAYLNLHTMSFTGGEIRGFFVPEPATLGLAAVGALTLLRRRRTTA